MKKRLVLTTFFTGVLLSSAGISYAAFSNPAPIRDRISHMGFDSHMHQAVLISSEYAGKAKALSIYAGETVRLNWVNFTGWIQDIPEQVKSKFAIASIEKDVAVVPIEVEVEKPVTLSEMQAMKEPQWNDAVKMAQVEPSGAESRWKPAEDTLSVEAVLVPRQVTVISSSQDGRIADVHVGQGDRFKKGDILIEYDCADLQAEAAIAGMEKDLTTQKNEGGDKLFKLDIISDIDRLGIQIEDKQAEAKVRLYEARMEDCRIRAQFDGHVTNRLANPGEYTRTDRVLMEVASDEPLQAEFLVPSKWLRWVNTGAPLNITINETEASYQAKISRIYGEVDPVSQSIQMIAVLDDYADPLLPGMSGQAKLSVSEMEEAGITGYLQSPSR